MADLVWIKWYATVLRQDSLAAEVAAASPIALRYGATQYQVHVDNDDRYRVTQMLWFNNKTDWYRYWDGPEMMEFRARNSGRFQIPVTYTWMDEIAAGAMGPEVPAGENGAPTGPNGRTNGPPAQPAPVPAAPQAQ
ncbi:MAG TPA: hypothetical protein VE127_05125 [Solirubrobacteraceae bacterium]|nr:hypothetical protein [Solirubrobacteraceae bacterium]